MSILCPVDTTRPPLTQTQRIKKIAAEADADPRTVAKYLKGQPVRSALLRERIERAVAIVNGNGVNNQAI